MERRRIRKRRHHNTKSNSPKPISIDLLKKNRHRTAHRKKIASVRLDLDESGGFSGSGSWNRTQILWKLLSLFVLLISLILVVHDIGWENIRSTLTKHNPARNPGSEETHTNIKTSPKPEHGSEPDPNSKNPEQNPDNVSLTQNQKPDAKPQINPSPVAFIPSGIPEALERISLARDTAKIGLYPQAIQLTDEAKSIDPELTGTDYLKAKIYQTSGQIELSRQYYAKAAANPDTHAIAVYQWGIMETDEKNFAKAESLLAESRKLFPKNASVASHYSHLLRITGKNHEGLFEAREASRLAPENRALKVTAILAAIQSGDYEPESKIRELAQSAETNSTTSPYDMVIAAAWARQQNRLDVASTLWAKIRPYYSLMPSLISLEKDPFFQSASRPLSFPPPASQPHHTTDQLPEDIPAPEIKYSPLDTLTSPLPN